MHGKQLVVVVGRDQSAFRGKKMNAYQGGKKAADEEKEGNGKKIENPDALMVFGQKPGFDAELGVQIMFAR